MSRGDIQFRRWHAMGMLFGYPSCCIRSFLEMRHLGGAPRKLAGTGYIPCAKCNEEYTAKQLIDNINANRQPDLPPFPNGDVRLS